MASVVQVVGFQQNPDPGRSGSEVRLAFRFHNIGGDITPDNHAVRIALIGPDGSRQDLGRFDVTLESTSSLEKPVTFTPWIAGDYLVDAVPDEGYPYQALVRVT